MNRSYGKTDLDTRSNFHLNKDNYNLRIASLGCHIKMVPTSKKNVLTLAFIHPSVELTLKEDALDTEMGF